MAPVLDEDAGLGEAGEQFLGEQLVADAGVERLDVGVMPRRAGLDERAARPAVAAPVLQRDSGQLRAVVATQELRRLRPP